MPRSDRIRILSVSLMLVAVGIAGQAYAEPLPLFFKSSYGDARDVVAVARKFQADDPAWQPTLRKRGPKAGQTVVTLHFPTSARAFPVRFGIPLGQVPSARNVTIFDEQNRPLRADVFPLVNFQTAPQHWVLVATVLDVLEPGDRKLTVKWGPDVRRPEPDAAIASEGDENRLAVTGSCVRFVLSAEDLLREISTHTGAAEFAPRGCRVGFKRDGKTLTQRQGRIITLYDGPLYKRFRVESTIGGADFKLHFDVETWADSPYVMVSSRLINESGTPLPLRDLEVFSIRASESSHAVAASGPNDEVVAAAKEIAVAQRVDDWSIEADGREAARGTEDNLGSWVRIAGDTEALTLVVPDFQGFGPGDPDLESRLSAASTGAMRLLHYTPLPSEGDAKITFWDTAARTFRMALHVGSAGDSPAEIAATASHPPSVRIDRHFLTEQNVFHEDRVTHVYDEASLEGARYFNRTRARRQDYPRMGRGMPPPKGEGFENVYTDSGGMLFGEVWQYASTEPGQVADAIKRARVPRGNLPAWYEAGSNVGVSTYRCGDQTLAIALGYLRTGDPEVFEIFEDHPLQFADFSIAHPEGYCHYYCHWRADNHVYTRLGGLVYSYLITGEPWFFEVAEQMGGHLVRAWNGKKGPRDTQTRSAYPGRGLVWLYEITGQRSYWNDAVDLAHWIMQTGMQPNGAMRGFANDDSRISPLYAGYTLLGLTPVYERCGNESLLDALRRCGQWLLTCQGDEHQREGSGTWPRDTLIGGRTNLGPGNCGSTTLCAELQTFLAEHTGRQEFFYSGAAAWANLVTTTRHRGIKGGMPMQAGDTHTTGTWSYTFPIYLHRLPAVAQQHGWPFVIEGVYDPAPERASPVVVFVAAGGRYDEKTLSQPLYVDNRHPVRLRIWSPQPPTEAMFAGSKTPVTYDDKTKIATVTLPAEGKPGLLVLSFR